MVPPIVLRSYHHVAAPDWRRYFHTVLRAGHVRASAEYVVRRDYYIGQDILFCLKGAGWIESMGKRYKVAANQLAWIANEHPHAHGPDPGQPWEFLWTRLDGPGLGKLRLLLFSQDAPVLSNNTEIPAWFHRLFDLMEKPTPRIDLRLYQLTAELFCHLGNSTKGNPTNEAWMSFPPSLLKMIKAVRMHPEQKWTVTKMARLACVSAAQLRKLSSHFLHMSPQQWLIRERIAVAQNLLTENSLSVGEIAERCGYSDIYHLSHEFKRHIGISPLAFRKNECLLK